MNNTIIVVYVIYCFDFENKKVIFLPNVGYNILINNLNICIAIYQINIKEWQY